jgi:hypothetical protein
MLEKFIYIIFLLKKYVIRRQNRLKLSNINQNKNKTNQMILF